MSYRRLASLGFASAAFFGQVVFAQNHPIAFVTSVSGNANLSSWSGLQGETGLAAADAICRTRATAAQLPHADRFVAWLSDDKDDAFCRLLGFSGKASAKCGQAMYPIAAVGPWWRTDGQPFAGDLDDFSYSRIFRRLDRDEFGAVSAAPRAFTATGVIGRKAAAYGTCQNWTSAAPPDKAMGGSLAATAKSWTDYSGLTCDSLAPIYCLQADAGDVIVDAPPRHGRLAFVTEAQFVGNLGSADATGHLGVAAADTLCRYTAGAQHLFRSFTYRAWISDGTSSAASRFLNDGPWYRIDGVRIAATLAQLSVTGPEQPLNTIEAKNAYLPNETVWTGVLANGAAASKHCNQWSAGSGATGQVGIANNATGAWTASQTSSCDSVAHLYCLADNDTLFADPFDRAFGF